MRREVAPPDIYMGFRVKGWQSVPFDEIRERDQRLVVHRVDVVFDRQETILKIKN
jgi:hypothetical protein